MKIALIDTRTAIAGESLGTLIGTFDSVIQAFAANAAWQKRCGPPHIITKIVRINREVLVGDPVHPGDLAQEGDKVVSRR
jgi:hypothetical protein